jgi:hypothetical protein
MAAPPIPPTSLSPATLVAALIAQNGAVLAAVKAALPTVPDGLPPGAPWANGDTIAFVATPRS